MAFRPPAPGTVVLLASGYDIEDAVVLGLSASALSGLEFGVPRDGSFLAHGS